jgi:hypothetical protein
VKLASPFRFSFLFPIFFFFFLEIERGKDVSLVTMVGDVSGCGEPPCVDKRDKRVTSLVENVLSLYLRLVVKL